MAAEQQALATKDSLEILQKELERVKKSLRRKAWGANADWTRWALTLLVGVTLAVMSGLAYQVLALRTELSEAKADSKIELNNQINNLGSKVKDSLLLMREENQKEFAEIKAMLECMRKGK